MKPAIGVGFFVDVAEGPQTYEFRLNGGGDLGGAVRVIDAAQSKRPLAANAPVVKAPDASAAAAVAAVATPGPTPAAVATPVAAATPKPPRKPSGDGSALVVWLGGGKAWRSEQDVLGTSHHVWDALGGVSWNFSPRMFASLGGEWRSGTQRVPTIDAPEEDVREDRHSVDVAAGYRLPIFGMDLEVGPALRYSRQEDEIAPHDFLLAGGFARIELPLGPLAVHASGEAGAPAYDGTPDDLRTGPLEGRTAWTAGLAVESHRQRGLSVGAEYRGESIARRFSERVSHGAFLNVQMGF